MQQSVYGQKLNPKRTRAESLYKQISDLPYHHLNSCELKRIDKNLTSYVAISQKKRSLRYVTAPNLRAHIFGKS